MGTDAQAFHRHTAEELQQRYGNSENPPEGWQETLAWHWEQAGAHREVITATLAVAETRSGELAFIEARRWTERALARLDRLESADRCIYEMRAYALTIVVLEFGGQYREALGYVRLLVRLSEASENVKACGRSYLIIGRITHQSGRQRWSGPLSQHPGGNPESAGPRGTGVATFQAGV